jgi:tetratricopeptide (TPR) repeat protein
MESRHSQLLNIGASSANYRRVGTAVEQKKIADAFLETTDEKTLNSETLKDLGMTYNEASFYETAIHFLTLALKTLETDDSISREKKNQFKTECLHGLANCQREYGNNDEAVLGYLKALDSLEDCKATLPETSYHEIEYRIQRDLGIGYLKIKAFQQAQGCFVEAQRCAAASKKSGRFAPVKSYEGLTQVLFNNSPDSITEGFQKLNEARTLYPPEERENSMDWAAHRYHMGRALQSAGDSVSALIEYAESLRLRKDMIPQQEIGLIYRHNRTSDSAEAAGDVCLELNLFDKAIHYFEIAKKCHEALHNHFMELKNDVVVENISKKLAAVIEKILSAKNKERDLEEKIAPPKASDSTVISASRLGLMSPKNRLPQKREESVTDSTSNDKRMGNSSSN